MVIRNAHSGGKGKEREEEVRDSTVGAKQHLIWESPEVRQQLGQYFIAPAIR